MPETVSDWLAGARKNTEWRKQLLKYIQQAMQAGQVQFSMYPNINICGKNVCVQKNTFFLTQYNKGDLDLHLLLHVVMV